MRNQESEFRSLEEIRSGAPARDSVSWSAGALTRKNGSELRLVAYRNVFPTRTRGEGTAPPGWDFPNHFSVFLILPS